MAQQLPEAYSPLTDRLAQVESALQGVLTSIQSLEGRLAGVQRAHLEAERFLARQHLEHFSLWSQYHLFAQLNAEESPERQAAMRECIEHIRMTIAESDHQVWHSERPLDDADEASQFCRKYCIERDVRLGV
ncbi:MAG: hypothetical protein EXR51_07425 [Dehalococcoidia bacterium]|nr:hypothetical protein [Dehalococcoidia bacterium]